MRDLINAYLESMGTGDAQFNRRGLSQTISSAAPGVSGEALRDESASDGSNSVANQDTNVSDRTTQTRT